MGDLDGKTVIVSGVGEGLGREIAEAVLRQGANAMLGARTEATLKKVADELDPSGQRVGYVTTDITNESDCKRLVDGAVQRFGAVNAVVNCAALDTVFGGLGTAGDFTEWRATFDVNIFGSLQMTRAALDELRKTKGAVVFVSSQTQHHPPPLAPQMAYAASKSALTGAMHHLAQEVGPDGVRVNEVTPSWMWGPPVEGFVNMQSEQRGVPPEQVVQEIAGNFPLRRMATDGEVADVIAFFCSDRAAAVTGQTLFVNCGEIMR